MIMPATKLNSPSGVRVTKVSPNMNAPLLAAQPHTAQYAEFAKQREENLTTRLLNNKVSALGLTVVPQSQLSVIAL